MRNCGKELRTAWLDACIAATLATDLLENAGPALTYFLTKGEEEVTGGTYSYESGIYTTGHTRRNVMLENAIKDSVEMQRTLIDNVNNAMSAAEKLDIDENVVVKFYNVTENNAIVEQPIDWNETLNRYRIKTENTVKRNGDSYELIIRYGIEDYYDWDSKLTEIKDIAPALLHEMHVAGMARNYTNYGSLVYQFTWKKGDRIVLEEIIE